MDYQTLRSPASMEKENLGKSRSPHFMTPTFSSSKQSIAVDTKHDHPATPVPARPIKAEGGNAWMKSAAKRVGFRRPGAGTPRNESPLRQVNTVSFPDKLATPSCSKLTDSASSTQKRVQSVSPKEKPLPSPPIAQLDGSSSTLESKTLIDAGDKPLRRRSPLGNTETEEDWPVLDPKRSTSPGTLREKMREQGSQLVQQAVSSEEERYPLLGNTVRHVPSEEQIPVSRYSESYKALTKNTPTTKLDPIPNHNEVQLNGRKSIDDPFKDGVYDHGPVLPSKGLPASPSGLSAAAAASAGRLRHEPKSTIEPRQTRTSSLRARLSAGQLVKDDHNKVVGFTDFTAPTEPTIARRESLRTRKEAQAGRSITPPVTNTVRGKSSRDSIGSNRAPAQFVGGSRRPAHPRRPSSRSSLHKETRALTPPLVPSRPAPPRPVSKVGNPNGTESADKGMNSKISSRKSSIPVPCASVEYSSSEKEHLSVSKAPGSVAPKIPKKEPRNENGIYQDRLSAEIIGELRATTPPPVNGWLPQISLEHNASRALEDIEESPQHTYQLKRLSLNTFDVGPTLKISPSANRFIMGPGPESKPLTKKRSKELDLARVKDDARTRKFSTMPVSAPKIGPERPSSSQGLSRLTPRAGLVDPQIREKKTKSADFSGTSASDRVQQESVKPTSRPCDYAHSSAKVSKSSTNTSNDPFFDAPEDPLSKLQEIAVPLQAEDQHDGLMDEAAWISPIKETKSVAGDGKILVLDEHFPAKPREGVKDDMKTQTKLVSKDAPAKPQPFTPEQTYTKHPSSSGSYPPRSSSRTPHHDLTSTKAPTSTPTTNKGPPTPPKDSPKEQEFSRRQNELGSLHGHRSSPLDLNGLAPKFESTTRDPARDPTRDSTRTSAHGSYKSQASVSKGMLSNFRGFFHKRAVEKEPLQSTKKSKSKVSITANGSPFPPISEVHPIHRPTLASMNRSNATTPRPGSAATPATPSFVSPVPTEVSTTTNLAMQILNEARNERSSPKKERLLELGKIMVDAVTQARDAEKAMEEAKQAARKAEVANALCKRSLAEVEKCVMVWRCEVDRSL
ncbi:hypothetical protein N7G274_008028 [Stereocaulon virgatum]|uniref:Uncharacterized protein n=1 Tax=Stereocaulon virgatum TaxID=373712 RepID=A0ABR4A2S4_9LECA